MIWSACVIIVMYNYLNYKTNYHEEKKVIEIQIKFIPSLKLVKPDRIFLLEGPLLKLSNRNGERKKYMFFLFNDILVYGIEITNQKYIHKHTLSLAGVRSFLFL